MNKRQPPDRSTKFTYVEAAPGIIVTPPDPREPIPTYLFPDDGAGEEAPCRPIFSLGTSLHSWPVFEQLLSAQGIEVVIDVRSSPRSRLPYFNQSRLRERLEASGIRYLFQGVTLGGRPPDGDADYETMATSQVFATAIEQVIDIAREHRTALICSEHEPLACHRCLLIGREITRRGVQFRNILRDGSTETQSETEDRLLRSARQTEAEAKGPREARLAVAYRLQNQRLNRQGARRGKPLGRRGG